jgi:hypothetical protein
VVGDFEFLWNEAEVSTAREIGDGILGVQHLHQGQGE